MNCTTMGLRISSLYIDKMQLCSLSVAYACLYHNPTTTMGHAVHTVDISKPFAHTTPYTLAAICSVQLIPGLISEEHTSPAYQWPPKESIWSRLRRRTSVMSRPWWGWRAHRWASLRQLLTVCAEILHQLSEWLVSDDPAGEEAGWGGPGLTWLHVVCGCEAGWTYCQILENDIMVQYGMNITFSGNSSEIPAVIMPIPRSLKTWDIGGIVLCDKTVHFRVAFYCPQHKVQLCNDHAV